MQRVLPFVVVWLAWGILFVCSCVVILGDVLSSSWHSSSCLFSSIFWIVVDISGLVANEISCPWLLFIWIVSYRRWRCPPLRCQSVVDYFLPTCQHYRGRSNTMQPGQFDLRCHRRGLRRDRGIINTSRQIPIEFLFIKTCPPTTSQKRRATHLRVCRSLETYSLKLIQKIL